MLSKAFFLAVLCSAALLANAAPEPQNSLRVRRSVDDKIKYYFKKLDNGTKNLWNKVKNIWIKFWDRVSGKESKRKQQEINALKAELSRLQLDSDRALSAVRAEWQAKLTAQEEELERLRVERKNLEKSKERLKHLQEQATQAINGVLNEWDEKADHLGSRIEKTLAA